MASTNPASAQSDAADPRQLQPPANAREPADADLEDGPQPLIRFAPGSARFYVETARLAQVESLIQKTHSEDFLKRLAETFKVDAKLFDLRQRLATFLNLTSSVDQARLSRLEIAMISTTPLDTASTVWLTRVPRPDILRVWFDPQRRTAETKSGDVVSFATDDGFTVCVRDDIVAMGRRQRGRSILREVYNNLTSEAATRSLQGSPYYKDLASTLPAGESFRVLCSTGGAKGGNLVPWSPVTVERVLFGAYHDEGSLRIAARGTHGEKGAPAALHPSAMEAFLRLPVTTLGAAAFGLDLEKLKIRFVPLFELLSALPVSETTAEPAADATPWQSRLEDLGPEVVVILGQPNRLADERPQIGLMIRCRDARAVRTDFSRVLANAIKWIGTLANTDDESLPKFKLATHLGTPIVYVSPGAFAEESRLGWMSTLQEMSPAWAAWGDWFMVTASLEHMQRLLDAQTGISSTIASIPEVARHVRTTDQLAGTSMLQPQLVASALESWSNGLNSLPDDHWINEWWLEVVQFVEGSDDHLWLDVFKFSGQRGGGTVTVSDVDAPPGAAVPLQSGDLIIGLNDNLLALNDPLETLENAWTTQDGQHILRVRLIRAGKAMEVDVVPGHLMRGDMAALLASPARMAKKAAELMEGVGFVGWTWRFGPDQHFAAELVVTCIPDK